jgi:hypothetical protein
LKCLAICSRVANQTSSCEAKYSTMRLSAAKRPGRPIQREWSATVM